MADSIARNFDSSLASVPSIVVAKSWATCLQKTSFSIAEGLVNKSSGQLDPVQPEQSEPHGGFFCYCEAW